MSAIPPIIIARVARDGSENQNPDLVLTVDVDAKTLSLTNADTGEVEGSFRLSGKNQYQYALTAKARGAQAGATQLLVGINKFTVVVTNGDSAILPNDDNSQEGDIVYVDNADAAQILAVYPPKDGTLGEGSNVKLSIAALSKGAFIKTATANTWMPMLKTGITSTAGGGAPAASNALTARINVIGTNATNLDSVLMPLSANFKVGDPCTVINQTAQTLAAFAGESGTIAGASSFTIAANSSRTFIKGVAVGVWH